MNTTSFSLWYNLIYFLVFAEASQTTRSSGLSELEARKICRQSVLKPNCLKSAHGLFSGCLRTQARSFRQEARQWLRAPSMVFAFKLRSNQMGSWAIGSGSTQPCESFLWGFYFLFHLCFYPILWIFNYLLVCSRSASSFKPCSQISQIPPWQFACYKLYLKYQTGRESLPWPVP